MITVEKLKAYGANTEEGLQRCMNNENFYLMLVNKMLNDNRLPSLREAIEKNDLQAAFEIAHSLKGVYGNLSITPLYDEMVLITEPLRNHQEIDYGPMLEKIEGLYQRLIELTK